MRNWSNDDIEALFNRVAKLEKDNHATKERLLEEISKREHQDRDEGRKTAEASSRDSSLYSAPGQGQEAQSKIINKGSLPDKIIGGNSYGTIEYPDGWYIAGPMSGYADHNFPAFHEVAARIRATGQRVVNPAELNPEKPGYSIAMRRDISQLLTCGRIMMLPRWERSKGAMVELQLAVILEMQVEYWEYACNRFK